MASYKLNLARIRGCPPPAKLAAALEEFGLPEDEEFGVMSFSAAGSALTAQIVRRTRQVVPSLDAETHEVTSTAVEKATIYPFTVRPQQEMLEIYAGAASGIEQVGLFLSGCLAFATVVEPIELEVPDAVERLMRETQKFQLRSIRVSDYSHNSYAIGPYAPKFTDTQHAMDFLEQYAEAVTTARVRFQAKAGKANVALSPTACFTYSCQEDDQVEVQALLRKLV